ncbi:MAG: peptide chain release factor N(5)-glutamine methyltransferase [Acidimicrobiales bacterium]|jgi:release factor glutamine methyltransferase
MTWRQLWRETAEQIVDPVAARWLLEEASGRDATALLGDIDLEAPAEVSARLGELVSRRRHGEPLQHVLGRWGFRTLSVRVDGRALVPRPETEFVVELALLELDRLFLLGAGSELLAADLGTGSGVIALSLVAERPAVRVIATDLDLAALELAASNISAVTERAAERLSLAAGDWFKALPGDLMGRLDLVVANPPYLAESEWDALEATVRDYDPYRALVAGPSGLEAVAAVVSDAPGWLADHGAVVVEIAPHQATAALELARQAGFGYASVEDDLAGRPRVLVARR